MSQDKDGQYAYTSYGSPSTSSYPAYSNVQEPPAYGGHDDVEQGHDHFEFGDSVAVASVKIRHAFILKVYTILTLQLGVTGGFCALFLYVDSVSSWAQANSWILWVNFICLIITMIVIFFKRRSSPLNIILLFLFTAFMSLSVGFTVSYYEVDEVVQAFLITAAVFVGLTLFACQTKFDFSGWAPFLFGLLLCVFVIGIFQIFFDNEVLTIVYCSLGVVVFCGYILFDTQNICKRLSPDEYIIAALDLYLDFVNLFLFILRLIGIAKN